MKAVIGSKATWRDLYQKVSVAPNTTCVASVWAKGTGAVQLQVWGNSNWTRLLAQVRCNGSPAWTKYTSAPFNTGTRTAVWLSLSDTYSSAAGTLFLDDVFLGPAAGTNRVLNPDFEAGPVKWTATSTVLQILRNP